jgi:hypothetical protein
MLPTEYCIQVQGHLAPEWSEWFDGLVVQCQPDGTTTLAGPIRDQAALHGYILKVRDLGLPLIAVKPLELKRDAGQGGAGLMPGVGPVS